MKTVVLIVYSLIFCLNKTCQTVDKIVAKEAFLIINIRDTVNTALIDGRSAEMFAEKHIKGAINIDAFKESLSNELKSYLGKEEIIVYCTNHKRAELITEQLEELQYQGKIMFITDGINGWISAGFSTVSI
jgi:rhodanese-related sulfurtransferase